MPIVKQPVIMHEIWYSDNPDVRSSLFNSILTPGSTLGTLSNNLIKNKIAASSSNSGSYLGVLPK